PPQPPVGGYDDRPMPPMDHPANHHNEPGMGKRRRGTAHASSRAWPPPGYEDERAPKRRPLRSSPPRREDGEPLSKQGGGGRRGAKSPVCRYFGTPRGCRNGSACPFRHEADPETA